MIEYSGVKKIHFVGIGGSGMSGIAEVLHNMGFVVSGSDIADSAVVGRLKKMGIRIYSSHVKENVTGIETLVYSSAITKENEELTEALKNKIPVIPRAEMLAELMRLKFSIAVAGTHGKTSTTSMIATILTRAKKDPTYVVGGKLKIQESGAKLGKSDYLVAEADESDGSFLQLFPTLAVITNIEDDHLDYYQSMDNLLNAFTDFGNKVPFYGALILNYDCPFSREIHPTINKRVVTYSLSRDTDLRVENVEDSAFGASFDLLVQGDNRGRVELNVGGVHNVQNALAAIAATMEIGVDLDTVREGLQDFSLPERRLQILFKDDDYLVVDDYAHHPTEIAVTLKTLKKSNYKRLFAVFQPHRYTRLEILMDRFSTCFNNADQLVVADLYAANQKEIRDVNSRKLVQKIKQAGFDRVLSIDDFDGIIGYLKENMQPGDAVVFLSAGNLTHTAHDFARQLEAQRR